MQWCRFYCRQIIIKNLGSDDWIMLVALVCTAFYRGGGGSIRYCIIRTAADLRARIGTFLGNGFVSYSSWLDSVESFVVDSACVAALLNVYQVHFGTG